MCTFFANTLRSAFVVIEFVWTVETMRYLLVSWFLGRWYSNLKIRLQVPDVPEPPDFVLIPSLWFKLFLAIDLCKARRISPWCSTSTGHNPSDRDVLI